MKAAVGASPHPTGGTGGADGFPVCHSERNGVESKNPLPKTFRWLERGLPRRPFGPPRNDVVVGGWVPLNGRSGDEVCGGGKPPPYRVPGGGGRVPGLSF